MSLILPSRRLAPAWVRNDLWRRARAVPSLDLRFAENKSLVDAISGQNLITFTRASSGTYVGSDGLLKTAATNEPRFDHNPLTGECRGLLVEEQRQNLLLRSGEISISSPWESQSTAPTITANAFVAPDGGTTATRVTFAAADSRVRQGSISVTSGITYTLSVYARPVSPGTLNKMRLSFFDGAIQYNQSDITLAAGWQRLSYTLTASNTGLGIFQIRNESSASVANDIYVWGAQLEAGAFPTSYIPTTGSAATRNADVVSITGTAFSSWYRQDEGTVFADTASIYNSGRYFMFDNGTTNERWESRYLSFLATTNSWSNNVQDVGISTNVVPSSPASNVRIASANASNNAAIASNGAGATLGTDTSSTMPVSQSRLWIGSFQGTATFANGPIRRLTYWPQRLSNATLQAITQ